MIPLLLSLLLSTAQAGPLEKDILGGWQYAGFQYDGHRYPNPNPNLLVRFTFFDSGIARLYWNRQDEPGYCERLADYRVEGNNLHQVVTWLNPENGPSCGRDPDMQMGRETDNRIEIADGELHLFMQLNGRDFIYILIPDAQAQATGPRP